MFVKFLMNPDPTSGTPDMTAIEVQELMDKEAIRYLPIVDEDMKLIGLVTKSSLKSVIPSDISQFSRFEVSYTLSKIKVQSFMVTDVVTIEEDLPIEHAAWLMADRRIGTLPVVSDGKLIGIISDSNIFIAMTSLLGAYEPGIRVTVLQPDKKILKILSTTWKKHHYWIFDSFRSLNDKQTSPTCCICFSGWWGHWRYESCC